MVQKDVVKIDRKGYEMKLYLLSQTDHTGYETFSAAVVAAESAEEAAKISPDVDGRFGYLAGWADSPERVKVMFIGIAAANIEAGVICSSYNAG